MSLKGKKIILAVSASIAAYKTPELARQLIKAGAEVQVILTHAASDLVSPLALATVSGRPVLSDISSGNAWNNHVHLAAWADAFLVAPCSARSLSRMAHGYCDNILMAVYLSVKCPVFIAPAMDEDMWEHPAVQQNIDKLKQFKHHILPVGHGYLASGLIGAGRMAEVSDIVSFLTSHLAARLPLTGKKALVTAGPTYEHIDPVRFIGNFSSGKMGLAIAEELAAQGAQVELVLGPSNLSVSHPGIRVHPVVTAEEMYSACVDCFENMDLAVMAAAVADYRPAKAAPEKIKKHDSVMNLELEKTKDILATLGSVKQKQFLVGFALETEQELVHAKEKLERKNADMLVLNSLNDQGAGFGYDTNKVTLLYQNEEPVALPLLSKTAVASKIVESIIARINYA